jgi:hypothetical protein
VVVGLEGTAAAKLVKPSSRLCSRDVSTEFRFHFSGKAPTGDMEESLGLGQRTSYNAFWRTRARLRPGFY